MTTKTSKTTVPTVTSSDPETVRLYECMVLLPAKITQKESSDAIKAVEELFTEKNGTQLHKSEWDRWGLAYTIKGYREGRYIVYIYELPPNAVKELDASLRLEKNILRHLFIQVADGYKVIDYPEQFRTWLLNRDKEEESQAKEKEEELKKKIVKRVSKKTVAPSSKKEASIASDAGGSGDLSEKLEELISDEDLNL